MRKKYCIYIWNWRYTRQSSRNWVECCHELTISRVFYIYM